MKLSDIMSAADLAIYAEVGLVLFMAAFLAVAARVLWGGREKEYEHAQRIPLSEETNRGAGSHDAQEAGR